MNDKCLPLYDNKVQEWIKNTSLENTYKVFIENNYRLPEYSKWKSFQTTIQQTEAKSILDEFLDAQKYQFEDLNKISQSLPSQAKAAFLQNVFYFNKNITLQEVYEEGFHAVFRTLTSSEERKQLLKAGQYLLVNRLKQEGKTINDYIEYVKEKYPKTYKSFTTREQVLDRLFEEEIASEFVYWKQFKNENITDNQEVVRIKSKLGKFLEPEVASKLAKFLHKIFSYIRNLFTRQNKRDLLETYFKSVESGARKNTVVNKDTETVPTTALFEYTKMVGDFDDDFNYFETESKVALSSSESAQLVRQLGAIYLDLYSANDYTDIDNLTDKSIGILKAYYTKSKADKVSLFDEGNVDKIRESLTTYINDIKDVTELLDEEAEDDNSTDSAFMEKQANEINPLNTSYASRLKSYIGTTGEIVATDIEYENKLYNIKEIVDVTQVYYAMVRTLGNTISEKDRFKRLLNFALLPSKKINTPTLGSSDTKKFTKRLLQDLFPGLEITDEVIKGIRKNVDAVFNDTPFTIEVTENGAKKLVEVEQITSNKRLLLNMLFKGFDLWTRQNNILIYSDTGVRLQNANENALDKIQVAQWEEGYTKSPETFQKAWGDGKILEQSKLIDEESFSNVEDFENRLTTLFRYTKKVLSMLNVKVVDSYVLFSILSNAVESYKKSKPETTDAQFISLLGEERWEFLKSFSLEAGERLTDTHIKEFKAAINTHSKSTDDTANVSPYSSSSDNGVVARLKNVANGNAKFDETVVDTTYKNADGKTIYGYQWKTFHLQFFNDLMKDPDKLKLDDRNIVAVDENNNPITLEETRDYIEQSYFYKQLFGDTALPSLRKAFKDGYMKMFTVDGLRPAKGDGVTFKRFLTKEFAAYLLNAVNPENKLSYTGEPVITINPDGKKVTTYPQIPLTPVYVGNLEASSTADFVYLPFITDIVDNAGNVTDKGLELLAGIFELEYNRIQKVANNLNEFGQVINGDTYNGYNEGSIDKEKGFKTVTEVIVKDETQQVVTYNIKSGYRGLEFSDTVNGFISANNLKLLKEAAWNGKPFDAKLKADLKERLKIGMVKYFENTFNELSRLGLDVEGEFLSSDFKYSKVEAIQNRQKQLGFKTGGNTDDIVPNVKKVILSNNLNTIFINTLINGDAALLFKTDNKDTVKRYKGRNAAIVSFFTEILNKDLGITRANKFWKKLVVDEFKGISNIKGIDGKPIDIADAQNWLSNEGMRYTLYGEGKLTKAKSQILNKLQNGTLSDEDTKSILENDLFTGVKKTVYFNGVTYDKKSDFPLTKQHTSIAVITTEEEFNKYTRVENYGGDEVYFPKLNAPYEVTKVVNKDGTVTYYKWVESKVTPELHEMRMFMEGFRKDATTQQWNYTGDEIYLVMPKSASKMAIRNMVKLDNTKSKIDWTAVKPENISAIDLRYYGLQVETPNLKGKINEPSQMVEIILNELVGKDKIFRDTNGSLVSANDLQQIYQDLGAKRSELSFKDTLDFIYDTATKTVKPEALKEVILDSLSKTSADKQSIDIFRELNPNHPLTKEKYIAQLLSHLSKGGFNHKRPGDAKALVSSYGHKLLKKIVKQEIDGEEIFTWQVIRKSDATYNSLAQQEGLQDFSKLMYYPTIDKVVRHKSNDLQSKLKEQYEKGELYFVDTLRHLKPRIENNKIIGYVSEALMPVYHADIKDLNDDVKYSFGVRIPSQDKHSAINLEWVDTLQAVMGSSIVVPQEVVELSGSDYDIDKLYISKPDGYFTKDEFGNKVFKKYGNSYFDWVTYQFQNNKELKKTFKEISLNFKEQREELQNLRSELYELMLDLKHINKNDLSPYIQYLTDEIDNIEKFDTYKTGSKETFDEKSFILNNGKYEDVQDYIIKYLFSTTTPEPLLTKAEQQELRELRTERRILKENKLLNKKVIQNIREKFVELRFKEDYIRHQILKETLDRLPNVDISEAKYNKDKNYVGLLNNQILDVYNQALTNKITLSEQTLSDGKTVQPIYDTPASMDIFDDVLGYNIGTEAAPKYLLSDDGKTYVNTNKINYNLHSLLGHLTAHQNNTTGKRNIGIDVNWNLLGIFLMRSKARIKQSHWIKIDGTTYNSFQYLNSEGQRTFDIISSFISAATDEAKEQLNARYGLTVDALNAVLPMIMMGVRVDIALSFVSQPIVKRYLELKALKRGKLINKADEKYMFMSDETLIKNLNDEYKQYGIADDYSIEDLFEGVRGRSRNQVSVLEDFKKMSDISAYGIAVVILIKMKKGLGSKIGEFDKILESIDKIANPSKKDPIVLGINDDVKQIKTQVQLAIEVDTILEKFILDKVKLIQSIKGQIKAQIKERLNEAQETELQREIESYLFAKMINPTALTPKWLNYERLKPKDITGSFYSVVKHVTKAMQEDYRKPEEERSYPHSSNILFRKLLPYINPDAKKQDIAIIKLNEILKTNDAQLEEYQDAYSELLLMQENAPDTFDVKGKPFTIRMNDFAEMLFNYYVLKDGFQFKYDGISKIFPVSRFKTLDNVIENLLQGETVNVDISNIIERFVQNIKHKDYAHTIAQGDGTTNAEHTIKIPTYLSIKEADKLRLSYTIKDGDALVNELQYIKKWSGKEGDTSRLYKLSHSTNTDYHYVEVPYWGTPNHQITLMTSDSLITSNFEALKKLLETYISQYPTQSIEYKNFVDNQFAQIEKAISKGELWQVEKEVDKFNKIKQNVNTILPTTMQKTDTPLQPKDYTNHSGGAEGSDIEWDKIGKKFGFVNNKHYWTETKTPHGNTEITNEDFEEGRFESAKAAKRNFGYTYSAMKDSRLIRNWSQVKHSDAIFAIGKIVGIGEKLFPAQTSDTRIAQAPSVTGGTGYAVGMAINHSKPTYVFNQTKSTNYEIGWYQWNSEVNNFVKIETPTLTKNFAGIGTREINDAGKQAIRDVYQKTVDSKKDDEQKCIGEDPI